MNKREWLDLFDKTCNEFKWFWDVYGHTDRWVNLMYYRENEDVTLMKEIMDDVWFELPDTKFNIMINPKGWKEFLILLEEKIDEF